MDFKLIMGCQAAMSPNHRNKMYTHNYTSQQIGDIPANNSASMCQAPTGVEYLIQNTKGTGRGQGRLTWMKQVVQYKPDIASDMESVCNLLYRNKKKLPACPQFPPAMVINPSCYLKS